MNRLKSCLSWFFVIWLLFPGVAGAIEIGARAPDFKLPSIEDREVSLADYAGQLVLLKIGTTWCPGCKELANEIDKLVPFLGKQKVEVLDVFIQDSLSMIEKALAGKTPYGRYHALTDDGSVHEAYSVYLIPRLLVVDENQVVRFDSAGQTVSADEIRAMVKKFAPAVKSGEKS